jgi:hypothetical protein
LHRTLSRTRFAGAALLDVDALAREFFSGFVLDIIGGPIGAARSWALLLGDARGESHPDPYPIPAGAVLFGYLQQVLELVFRSLPLDY